MTPLEGPAPSGSGREATARAPVEPAETNPANPTGQVGPRGRAGSATRATSRTPVVRRSAERSLSGGTTRRVQAAAAGRRGVMTLAGRVARLREPAVRVVLKNGRANAGVRGRADALRTSVTGKVGSRSARVTGSPDVTPAEPTKPSAATTADVRHATREPRDHGTPPGAATTIAPAVRAGSGLAEATKRSGAPRVGGKDPARRTPRALSAVREAVAISGAVRQVAARGASEAGLDAATVARAVVDSPSADRVGPSTGTAGRRRRRGRGVSPVRRCRRTSQAPNSMPRRAAS